jgi:signal transduction histidine kinase
MAVVFLFHFICAVEKKIERRLGWILVAYIASAFFAISSPMALYSPRVKTFVDGISYNILFGAVLVPFIAAGIGILFASFLKAGSREERSRWGFTLTAVVITVVTGLTDLVQKLQFPVPPLGHLGSVIGPSILAVGVFRHREVFDVLTKTRRKLDALEEIASGIAHEIRNPLTAIKGAVRLQAHEINNNSWEGARQYQGIISDEIQRLEGVLASFLDFSKPLKLDKRVMCINDLVNRTVEMAALEPAMISLDTDLVEQLPQCEVDPTLMRQVLVNILRNACEACGPDGQLTIRTEWVSPWVKVRFTDNGPGFEAKVLQRALEPFFTTREGGMGIGLSICRRIVTAHEGRLEVGNAPDGGAVILISLRGLA